MQPLTVVDSWLRCIYDGKKLIIETYTHLDGEERNRHVCWNCDYVVIQ